MNENDREALLDRLAALETRLRQLERAGLPSSTAITAHAIRNSNQSITTGTWTAISFNSQTYDTDSIWSAGSPTRFTVTRTGYYDVGGSVVFDAVGLGQRGIAIRKQGVTWMGMMVIQTTTALSPQITTHTATYLTTGQYIEVMVYHNRGIALNIIPIGASYYANAGWITRQA